MRRAPFMTLLCAAVMLAGTGKAQAATSHRVIPRAEWGADESLLLKGAEEPEKKPESTIPTDEGNAITKRVRDCEEAQRLYPQEFKAERTITKDAQGRELLWPQSYSSQIKLLVIHHTDQFLGDDARTPLERVRALYQYHARTLGWGDVGYHYLIDENGQIYEGRAGGDRVIGGHVYCANTGTIGIALMGAFEQEEPTQDQIQGLQWLLSHLAERHDLDLSQNSVFHGKSLPVIVGHKDLVSTACPGYFLAGVLSQIRTHVLTGDLTASVVFPPRLTRTYADRTTERRMERLRASHIEPKEPTLTPLGSTTLTVRPGGQVTVSLLFRAGDTPVQRRARVASVVRSSNRIGIWQQLDENNLRVREDILLPRLLHEGEVETIRLRFQAPEIDDTYTVDIGPVTYVLSSEGRRIGTRMSEPTRMTFTELDRLNIPTPGYQRSLQTSSASRSSLTSTTSQTSPLIRIRLTQRETGASTCTSYDLASIAQAYHGSVTCSIIEGKAALINEVPLEDYLKGLAEEPDTEPYEKQRAFAIAARSYAVFYLNPSHRKFPGMPYDGDDSPARFQAYTGISAEHSNPQWMRAVEMTRGRVLTVNGAILKAAYFSSDDGRTRSPAENGWTDFPFEEVFSSKPDPWCRGFPLAGHGVGMSGCGAKGQANEGRTAEEILQYYYPGTIIEHPLP